PDHLAGAGAGGLYRVPTAGAARAHRRRPALSDRQAHPMTPDEHEQTDPPPILPPPRTALPAPPPQQQLLARAALEAPAEVGRMTITEYAALAGASAASVTRLCRSLGIEKFSLLRTELVLAAEQRSGAGSALRVTGDITAQTP